MGSACAEQSYLAIWNMKEWMVLAQQEAAQARAREEAMKKQLEELNAMKAEKSILEILVSGNGIEKVNNLD